MTKPSMVRESNTPPYGWLADCKDTDFDGHSNFSTTTPDQKLEWLAIASALVRDFKGRADIKRNRVT